MIWLILWSLVIATFITIAFCFCLSTTSMPSWLAITSLFVCVWKSRRILALSLSTHVVVSHFDLGTYIPGVSYNGWRPRRDGFSYISLSHIPRSVWVAWGCLMDKCPNQYLNSRTIAPKTVTFWYNLPYFVLFWYTVQGWWAMRTPPWVLIYFTFWRWRWCSVETLSAVNLLDGTEWPRWVKLL